MARKGRGKPAAAPKPKFDVEEIRPYVTDEWGRVAKEVEKYEERHHKNIRKSVGRLRAAYNAAMRKLQETGEAKDFQVEIAEQVKKGNDLGKVKGELNNELGDIKAGPMIKLLYSVQENISSKVAEVTGATTTEMKARAALMSGKMKLKGPLVKALRLSPLVDRLNEVISTIPTEY